MFFDVFQRKKFVKFVIDRQVCVKGKGLLFILIFVKIKYGNFSKQK